MAVVTVNGVAVAEGFVVFQLLGRWVAEMVVTTSTPSDVTGSVTLAIGASTFVGWSESGADEGNRVTVSIVGGSGGFKDQVTPQHYVQPFTVGTVVADALAIGSERLSVTSDTTITGKGLSQWARVAGTVSEAVRAVLEPLGASWRTLPDGSFWVGTETWLPATADPIIEDEVKAESKLTIQIEDATILPGVMLGDRKIRRAVYRVTPSTLRADLTYGDDPTDERAAQEDLIAQETRRFDYHAPYTAKVVAQGGDNTLELQPTDPRMPPMSKVPLRATPGLTQIRLNIPTFVILQFENGSPSAPYASAAHMTSAQKVVWDAPDIRLGGDLPARALAFADVTKANDDQFQIWAATHTHSGGTIGGSTGVPAAPPPTPQDPATQRVKGV